jgi:hypothetical protein
VESKSLVDLVASITGGKLRCHVAELAALPGPRSCSRTASKTTRGRNSKSDVRPSARKKSKSRFSVFVPAAASLPRPLIVVATIAEFAGDRAW